MKNLDVLVSGAGFAGLTTAYWLNKQGYHVTLVEVSDGLKKGGTPVDIVDQTVEIVRRMGVFDLVLAHSLPPRSTEFTTAEDVVGAQMAPASADDDTEEMRYEVPRDDLLRILFELIEDEVEVIFGDSVTALSDAASGVRAQFRSGAEREFAMVIGCDGNHSRVRKLQFGDESQFSHFLGNYFAISIVDKLIIDKNVTEIFSVPGKTVMLNSYTDKTDVCFAFHSDTEIPYDYRNQEQMRRIVAEQFENHGGRSAVLLDELAKADNFYFDKLCQIKMPRWSDGNIVLVGDAAYCASPAAGMGGSLAIIGATAFADALEQHGPNFQAAFDAYERNLRPFVEDVQAQAVDFGIPTFFPETADHIRARDEFLFGHAS
ncbi:FAD-dependent oxidoreductase [Rhodococcoides trifolii]|uniref:FAD-dependent oxidoreductase n=1 Tax=Rhodococcoides trifolii TaxID=908250 RepID=A0A917CZ11_9NOCA|nr:FAD-dependent monooxygenase [Rhodococcus trifolii]GGG03478.1 FAD-dependent oxidoreductase [Rhodococcus trifolii]